MTRVDIVRWIVATMDNCPTSGHARPKQEVVVQTFCSGLFLCKRIVLMKTCSLYIMYIYASKQIPDVLLSFHSFFVWNMTTLTELMKHANRN